MGTPVRAHGHLCVPVARVWLDAGTRGAAWAAGGRHPVAVVIRDPRGTRAVDIDGNEVSLDALVAEVDGLAAALAEPKEKEDP